VRWHLRYPLAYQHVADMLAGHLAVQLTQRMKARVLAVASSRDGAPAE